MPRDREAVVGRLDLGAEPAQPADHGLDPIRLLVAQLLGARDDRLAVGEAAGERHQRQLVDRQRHLAGADPRRLQRAGAGDDRRRRLALGRRRLDHLERRSHPGQDPEQADPAGVDADALEPHLAAADEQRGDDPERGRGEVAGDGDLAGRERGGGLDRDPGRRQGAVDGHRGAGVLRSHGRPGGAQHALGVVAGRAPLDHGGRPVGEQPGEQQAGLHLRARDRQPVLDPVQLGASHAQRGQPIVARRDLGAHQPQRLDRPGRPVGAGSTRRRRGVHSPPGCPASQPGSSRSSVPALPTSIGSPVASAPRSPTPRPATAPRRACRHSPVASDLGAERLAPPRGSSACRRPRGSCGRRSRPRRSPRSAPRGGRSTCRAAGDSAPRSDPAGSKRVTCRAATTRDDVAEPADDLRGALGLGGARDPDRDRPGAHVGRRVERHVLDVDLAVAERERDLGHGPGPVLDPDPQLAQLAAGEVGLEQPAAVVAGVRVPLADRVAVAVADQRRGRAQPLADRRRSPRRRRRGCWRRCPPRSPGWRRRPGSCRESELPTSGSRSDSSESAAAASATSTFASTCGRWLTVAITRSWVAASIACGRAPRSATVLCSRS